VFMGDRLGLLLGGWLEQIVKNLAYQAENQVTDLGVPSRGGVSPRSPKGKIISKQRNPVTVG